MSHVTIETRVYYLNFGFSVPFFSKTMLFLNIDNTKDKKIMFREMFKTVYL